MASLPVTLYYFPPSYYSQKALVALDEKKVDFKSKYVKLTTNEEDEPWFLRLNPAGQIPLLQVGDKYTPESLDIIREVDKLNNAPQLIPDPSTPEGKLVREWTEKLNIEAEPLTYGIFLNPDLAESDLKIPSVMRFTKQTYVERIKKRNERLEAVKLKCPELTEVIDKKIEMNMRRITTMFSRAETAAFLEMLEGLLDDVEAQLRKVRIEHILEHWLCGPSFKVADIQLCVLLGRLDLLGMLPRYLKPEKRSALVEYWNNARQRPSIKKYVVGAMSNAKAVIIKDMVTKVAAGTAVAGGVLALGLFLGLKFTKG